GTATEPVDLEDARCTVEPQLAADVEPVREVVAHVVSAERQHRERVAAQFAHGAFGCRSALGGDRRTEEDAVSPVSGLDDEGDVAGTATAEEDDVQRHRLLPVIRYLRALRGGDREARVRVRGGATRI